MSNNDNGDALIYCNIAADILREAGNEDVAQHLVNHRSLQTAWCKADGRARVSLLELGIYRNWPGRQVSLAAIPNYARLVEWLPHRPGTAMRAFGPNGTLFKEWAISLGDAYDIAQGENPLHPWPIVRIEPVPAKPASDTRTVSSALDSILTFCGYVQQTGKPVYFAPHLPTVHLGPHDHVNAAAVAAATGLTLHGMLRLPCFPPEQREVIEDAVEHDGHLASAVLRYGSVEACRAALELLTAVGEDQP